MWIKDEEFIRGNIPMSKFETRVLALVALNIEEGDRFLDIGAGTGSISIQAAMLGAEVLSIEREKEGVELIRNNAEKFGKDINILEGSAPEIIPDEVFDKIFIGGSGGSMEEIIDESFRILKNGGVIAATFITLGNMHIFKSRIEKLGMDNIETKLIQVSRLKTKAEMLIAENPIFIIRGEKNE